MSGTCRRCGSSVTWAKRGDWEDARWLPPLEIVDRMFVVDFGPPRQRGVEPPEPIAQEVLAYRIHECKPDDIENYERRQVEQAQVLSAAENGRLEMTEFCSAVECRKCGSGVGELCVNLSKLYKTGEEVPVRYPHPDRVTDAGWWEQVRA